MSSPILPPEGPSGLTAIRSMRSAAGERRSTSTSSASAAEGAAERAVSLDTFPSSPPREVLEQMAVAGGTYESLLSQGRELHFSHDENGHAAIRLRDQSGDTVRTLSVSEALELAAGKSLE